MLRTDTMHVQCTLAAPLPVPEPVLACFLKVSTLAASPAASAPSCLPSSLPACVCVCMGMSVIVKVVAAQALGLTTYKEEDKGGDHGQLVAQRDFGNCLGVDFNKPDVSVHLGELSKDIVHLPASLAGRVELCPKEGNHKLCMHAKVVCVVKGQVTEQALFLCVWSSASLCYLWQLH